MGSLGQRWTQSRPTKTFVFWSCVAVVIATVTVGFTWGGWVTSSTAQTTAKAMAEDAVVHRLTPICVAAAKHDPASDKKLKELKNTGWATMPGNADPDSKVADECAKILASLP
jgi:acid phosphatase class B